MDMVERVARAAHDAQWEEPFPAEGSIAYAIAMQVARAAIEAMRIPTDEMILAGAQYHHDNWRKDHAREDTNAGDIWNDMIDAALQKETPAG